MKRGTDIHTQDFQTVNVKSIQIILIISFVIALGVETFMLFFFEIYIIFLRHFGIFNRLNGKFW